MDALKQIIRSRTASDKEEGDIAFFYALLAELEYIAKLLVAGAVSCIDEDVDRNRYSLEYSLVRANSLGEWTSLLQSALTGPAAQFFREGTEHIARDLTQRVRDDDWRYETAQSLESCRILLGMEPKLGQRVALRHVFEYLTEIRNRTRGHGAITSEECSIACPELERSINLLWSRCELFKQDWAYLHRNLSGKYRVSPLLGDCQKFNYLKNSRDVALANGVYVFVDEPILAPLVFSNLAVDHVSVPNGNFSKDSFETLSPASNSVGRQSGQAWSNPPGRLPASQTEGRSRLDQFGNVFTNMPEPASGHVTRMQLETQLTEELLETDRHPIITLTGPGGIGKTTLSLVVTNSLATRSDCPYETIVWLSSRDVDLLDSGPKPVQPLVVTQESLSREVAELLEPADLHDKHFDPKSYFEGCLRYGAAGTTLFILDNFETTEDPLTIYKWVDTHVRHPNKLLITTRFREFQGDFPIEIRGMSDDEARALVAQQAARLGVRDLVTDRYSETIIEESDGHPYVIKILLGQVAAERRALSPERIIANADQLLLALFERTYTALSPAAQRTFLLLSSWRATIPAIAVEAVSLRPQNERFDVSSALDELRRYSFIEETRNADDDQSFVGVPLAAASFGRRKMLASPLKPAVELDRKILMEFGAGDKNSSRKGVIPRIDRLVATVARRASEDPDALETYLPILEYLGTQVPVALLRIATLLEELPVREDPERILSYLYRYLESTDDKEREHTWLRIASICLDANDTVGEVHALGEVAMLPSASPETLGMVANKINNRLRTLRAERVEQSWSGEVLEQIKKVAERMWGQLSELDATGCSRLAWLYLNIGNSERANDVARAGLGKNQSNEHCLRILARLDS